MMASLGMADTLILMVLALVVFGPRRLPQIGRQIGKLMYEFRKASNDFKFQMEEELRQAEEADRRKKEEAERQRALAAAPPPPQIAPPAETPIQSAEPAYAAPSPEPPAKIAADTPDRVSDPSEATTAASSESAVESPVVSAPAAPLAPEPASSAEPVPTTPESSLPRIQPPATGEKVAAERPGAHPQQRDLFASDTGKAPESETPEAERSEPATHHG